MKKFLLTATMLVAFTALSKAQQGRVGINTTTPAATLDVVANTTDNARPDAVLVPRMSRAELEAKNNAYANGSASGASAQNGALVFVNALGGTGTGKTVNVVATGFHYYDGTNGNNVWRPLVANTVPAGMSVRLQTANTISDADLGNAIIVNTIGSSFNLDALTKSNGKIITFIDNTSGFGGFSVTGTPGTISPQATVSPTGPGGALSYICDGAVWYSYSSF